MDAKIIESKEAYVAFLDILGFKDLIKNNNPNVITSVFDKISGLSKVLFESNKKALKELSLRFESLQENGLLGSVIDNANVNMLSISDSFVLWTNDDSPASFMSFLNLVKFILRIFLEEGVPLRGAISVGPLTASPMLFSGVELRHYNIFGKAIVRAYELEGKQQWAGCIVDDDCITKLKEDEVGRLLLCTQIEQKILVPYYVPQKNGPIEMRNAVNWARGIQSQFVNQIPELFASHNKNVSSWDIKVKIDNTVQFFEYIKKCELEEGTLSK